MCGRYGFWNPIDEMQEHWGAQLRDGIDYQPRYNIAPGQQALVISNEEPGDITEMQWGLIPSWAKDASQGRRLINARVETAAHKPSFRESFARRRCIVIASGFYEWKKIAGGKQPYLVAANRPWGFAGLWSEWTDPKTEEKRKTFTILTTEPNRSVRAVHDRMPVLIGPKSKEDWLANGKHELLKAAPEAWVSIIEISNAVNNPRNEGPRIIEPLKTQQSGLGDF